MHTKLHASLFEEGSSSSSSSSTNSDVLVINTSSSLNWSNGDIETVIIAMKQIAHMSVVNHEVPHHFDLYECETVRW